MKHIKLKVIYSGHQCEETWWVRIVEQTHREKEFGPSFSSQFVSKRGLILASVVEPSATNIVSENKVYMRGSDVARDWQVLVFYRRDLLEQFREAVMDYNLYFSRERDTPRTETPAQFEYEVG